LVQETKKNALPKINIEELNQDIPAISQRSLANGLKRSPKEKKT
jgi:hypothetical protein